MNQFDGSISLVRALDAAARGPLSGLVHRLKGLQDLTGPKVDLFVIGLGNRPDAGLAVSVWGRRSDGRTVEWLVQVWLEGSSAAVIKAEIDLDDGRDEPQCVLNEQLAADSVEKAVEAIAYASALVADFPTADLLADGWGPSTWAEGDL